jgi:hypothetical protein
MFAIHHKSRLSWYSSSNVTLQEAEGEGATQKQIKDLIGNPTDLQFARVLSTGFKTLDGRINGHYLATPGGDAGEFVLGLQIFQDMQVSTTGESHLTK